MITILVISIITSLITSFVWSKWFMHNLTKWMEKFFDEELKLIKEILRR